MKCRRTVQKHWVLTNNIGENIPHLSGFPLDHFFGRLDGCGKPFCLKLAKDEWLEQLERHFLRKATLMET